MKTTRDFILKKLAASRSVLRRHGVRRLAIFGSAVRGERNKNSDLDFLVEFNQPTFDAYMDLKTYLEKRFRCKVDLVLADALKPRLRPVILNQAMHVPGL